MAWCPVCKNEYRPGIKICADCGAELVESLDENPSKALIYGQKELMDDINGFLKSNGVKESGVLYDPTSGNSYVNVPESDLKRCTDLLNVYMNERESHMKQKAMQEAVANATPEQLEAMKKMAAAQQSAMTRKPAVYESSKKKMEENKASAWSLLIAGLGGIIFIVLCLTGVIPANNFFQGSYLFFGIMGGLCLIFVIAGIVSFKSAKGFEKDVESENSLKATLETWCKENLRGEDIDRYIKMRDPSLEGESLFFPRNELIKARINHQFMNLDQDFLDRFVDDVVYEMVYPNEEA